MHVVRETVDPPDVNDPFGHEVHALAPPPEYEVSALQPVQRLLEASLNDPALHRATRLDPSHDEPAGHPAQVVLVFLLFPDVNIPGPQMLHALEALRVE